MPAHPVVVLLAATHDRHNQELSSGKPVPFPVGSSTLQLCSIAVEPVFTEKKHNRSSHRDAKKEKTDSFTRRRRRRALVQIFARIRPADDAAAELGGVVAAEKEYCVATFILPRYEDMMCPSSPPSGSAAAAAAANTKKEGAGMAASPVTASRSQQNEQRSSNDANASSSSQHIKSSFVRRPLQSNLDMRFTMEQVVLVPRLLLVGDGWGDEPYSVSANIAVAGVVTPLGL